MILANCQNHRIEYCTVAIELLMEIRSKFPAQFVKKVDILFYQSANMLSVGVIEPFIISKSSNFQIVTCFLKNLTTILFPENRS